MGIKNEETTFCGLFFNATIFCAKFRHKTKRMIRIIYEDKNSFVKIQTFDIINLARKEAL